MHTSTLFRHIPKTAWACPLQTYHRTTTLTVSIVRFVSSLWLRCRGRRSPVNFRSPLRPCSSNSFWCTGRSRTACTRFRRNWFPRRWWNRTNAKVYLRDKDSVSDRVLVHILGHNQRSVGLKKNKNIFLKDISLLTTCKIVIIYLI